MRALKALWAEARAHAPEGLRIACLWLCAASLSWALVLLAEVVRGEGSLDLGEAAYLCHLSLLYSGFGSLPVLGVHVVRLATGRVLHSPLRGELTGLALVAVLAVSPAIRQAEFLTSGSDISASRFVEPLRYILFGGIVLGYVALWSWHRLGRSAPAESAEGCWRAVRRLSLRGLWFLLGLACLGALVYIVSFKLKAYAFFAVFLVLPAWFLAATLGYALLRHVTRGPGRALLAFVVLVASTRVLAFAAPREMAQARTAHMREGKVIAWTDLIVYPSDTRFASFQIGKSDDVRCPPQERVATVEPLALPRDRRRNVLLISVDAMRADAMRWKVKDKPLMPNLQAFAASGIDYRRAVTTYPATLFAAAGALSGLSASQVLFAPSVPDNVFTLSANHIKERRVLLPNSRWFRKPASRKLLLSGAEVSRHKTARQRTDALIHELRQARKKRERVLAWLHYYAPHAPYRKHKGLDFGDDEKARYMSELGHVDRQLGRLFDYLDRSGFLRDSLVIVFSDHGEAMGEQDYFGHHVYLNSWITDIPLIVHAPGRAPRVSYAIADVTDIAATVLHYLGIARPPQMVGMSLLLPENLRRGRVSFAEAFPIRGKNLFSFTKPVKDLVDFRERMDRIHQGAKNYLPKVSAVTARHRLIVNRVTGLEEFYDRQQDPHEQRDLSWDRLAEHRALRDALSAWSREQARRLYCAVAERDALPAFNAAPTAEKSR